MAKPQWANWSWGETPCYHPPKSFDTERPTVESHPVGENWLGSLWFTGHILFCLFLGVLIVKNTFSVLSDAWDIHCHRPEAFYQILTCLI